MNPLEIKTHWSDIHFNRSNLYFCYNNFTFILYVLGNLKIKEALLFQLSFV